VFTAWTLCGPPLCIYIEYTFIHNNWLRVPERIQYKIAVLTYKVLHDTAPPYLGPLDRVADLHGRRALRSASSSCLVVPMSQLSTVDSRAFSVSGPRMDCPKTLFRRRHFPVSGADLNPSSSSSHILILSSNCTFDTIVVLVAMFITLATLKITELNWTELNWTASVDVQKWCAQLLATIPRHRRPDQPSRAELLFRRQNKIIANNRRITRLQQAQNWI